MTALTLCRSSQDILAKPIQHTYCRTLIYLALIPFILLHFINSAIVALKSDIVTFYGYKINRGDIWLQWKSSQMTLWYKNFKNKSENSNISCDKPQGVARVSKIQKTKWKTTLVSWSAKIQPKLNDISKKPLSKQVCFLTIFVKFWHVCFAVSSILAL